MTRPAWLRTRWAGRDARDWQIAVLSCLLTVQLTLLDFGASLGQAAVMVSAALGTQALASALVGRLPDWRSPLITGLSLSLLLRTHDPAVWVARRRAGDRLQIPAPGRRKHVFNPACFAIVVLVLTGQAWVSPGQWGALAWSALLLGGGGALVLGRARRVDTAAAFLGATAAAARARCVLRRPAGDPAAPDAIGRAAGLRAVHGHRPAHHARTAGLGRIAFAASVAALAYALQFGWQVREGLFYALALAAPLVPLLDRLARPLHPGDRIMRPSASPSSPPPR